MKFTFLITITFLCLLTGFSQTGSLQAASDSNIIDYAINDIGVNEYNTVKEKLGQQVIDEIDRSASENKDVWIHAKVFSKDLRKQFVLYLQEGSACCQYFEVSYTKQPVKAKGIITKFEDFESDNGIKLGIDTAALMKKLPLRFMRSISGKQVIFAYTIYEEEDNKIIDRKRYIAQYVFKDNKLVKFGFGNIYAIPNEDKR